MPKHKHLHVKHPANRVTPPSDEPRAPRTWLDGWIASYRVELRRPIDPNRRQPLITLND